MTTTTTEAETPKFITDWAKAWKVNEEELKEEFNEIVEKFREENPNKSPEIIAQNAKNQMKTKHTKFARKKGSNHIGYVLAVGNIRNNQKRGYEELQAKVEEYRSKGELSKAVDEGLIRIDGKTGEEIILTPKLKKDGDERKDAGKDFILEEKNTQDIHMLADIGGILKYVILEIQGLKCDKQIVERGKVIEFNGIPNNKQEDNYFKPKLGAVYYRTNRPEFVLTRNVEFEKKIHAQTPEELARIFEGIPQLKVSELLDDITTIKNLRKEIAWDIFAVTNGLAELDLVTSKSGKNVKIYLEDEDVVSHLKFQCLVPVDNAPFINFADGSKIYAIGSGFASRPQNDKAGEPDGVMFNAVIVSAYPDFLVPLRDNGNLTEDDIIPKESKKKAVDEVF